jgi:hypothetical protein
MKEEKAETVRPFVIYPAVSGAHVHKQMVHSFPKHGCRTHCVPSRWMDEETFLDWIKECVGRMPDGQHGLLVVDMFAAHRTDRAKALLAQYGWSMMLIPGGCTSLCQVHDVAINSDFKHECKLEHLKTASSQAQSRLVARI